MFKFCAIAAFFLATTAQVISDAYVKVTSDTGQMAGN